MGRTVNMVFSPKLARLVVRVSCLFHPTHVDLLHIAFSSFAKFKQEVHNNCTNVKPLSGAKQTTHVDGKLALLTLP